MKMEILSRNEINDILQIMGNYAYRDNISMRDVIKVMYLFEDKATTEKERQEFLKQFENN